MARVGVQNTFAIYWIFKHLRDRELMENQFSLFSPNWKSIEVQNKTRKLNFYEKNFFRFHLNSQMPIIPERRWTRSCAEWPEIEDVLSLILNIGKSSENFK